MANHHPYWYWENQLTLKEIKKLNKLIMSNYDSIEPQTHKAHDLKGVSKKNLDSYIINYQKVKPYVSRLLDLAFEANRKSYGYDIWKYRDADTCLYNVYPSNKQSNYDWHVDEDPDPYADMKFTMIINLSEKPFVGGDLFLQKGDEIEVKELKKPGTFIIFKSYTRHMVTPVTQGERRNLVLFLTGPNFK